MTSKPCEYGSNKTKNTNKQTKVGDNGFHSRFAFGSGGSVPSQITLEKLVVTTSGWFDLWKTTVLGNVIMGEEGEGGRGEGGEGRLVNAFAVGVPICDVQVILFRNDRFFTSAWT